MSKLKTKAFYIVMILITKGRYILPVFTVRVDCRPVSVSRRRDDKP